MIFTFFIIIILVFIDQLVKNVVINNVYNSSITIVKGIIKLTYVENKGGAFGIGYGNTSIIAILNIIIIGALITYIVTNKDKINMKVLVGIALVIAGGIGNLIDRIFRGFVIDYIDINQIINYPMFNLADICVVIRKCYYCIRYSFK